MERDVAAAQRAPRRRRAQAAEAQARETPRALRRARPSGTRPGSPRRSRSPRRAACCRGRSAARSLREFGGPDGCRRDDARHLDRDAPAGRRRPRPADGWVAFAGPFRSYGQLLIINAGGGYYLLLAGMDQINVEVGQFVLAGEPVGDDGRDIRPVGGQRGRRNRRPRALCRVPERRRFDRSGPWWAKSQSEKVRG